MSTGRWNRLCERLCDDVIPPFLTPGIGDIVEEIRNVTDLCGFGCRIGIQLPDGLKRFAAQLSRKFSEVGYEVLISGNSCFGACDIDVELAREVDALLHFAHSPILDVERVLHIPVFVDYSPRIPANFDGDTLTLIATVQYCHRLPEVKKWLEELGYKVELRKGSGRVVMEGQVLGCNYTALRGAKGEIVFIGDGRFHAVGAAIYTGKRVYAVNPRSREVEVIEKDDVESFIRNRYFQVSRCVGMERAGIIVSSKPGQRRMGVAKHLARIAKEKGVHADVIYVNDITAEKLDNMPYEYYINTACPRISYDDSKNYRKPILTPHEFLFLLDEVGDIALDEIE